MKQANRTERELLQEISLKLDRLAGLLAIQGKDLVVQVRILSKLGLPSPEIGGLLNVNADYVRQLRTKGRRRQGKKA